MGEGIESSLKVSSVFSDENKALLRKRVTDVNLQLPPPASIYSDEPDLFTKSDVYYERLPDGKMHLRVGGVYLLAVSSRFNMIFTFAHELGHSIDPCELRSLGVIIPSYEVLSSCFIQKKLVAQTKGRMECSDYDQLSETFADWLAVQVMGVAFQTFATEFDHEQLLRAVSNSVKDLCEQDESLDEPDETFHPSPRVRINHIFGEDRTIRKILKCPVVESGCYLDFSSSGSM